MSKFTASIDAQCFRDPMSCSNEDYLLEAFRRAHYAAKTTTEKKIVEYCKKNDMSREQFVEAATVQYVRFNGVPTGRTIVRHGDNVVSDVEVNFNQENIDISHQV